MQKPAILWIQSCQKLSLGIGSPAEGIIRGNTKSLIINAGWNCWDDFAGYGTSNAQNALQDPEGLTRDRRT